MLASRNVTNKRQPLSFGKGRRVTSSRVRFYCLLLEQSSYGLLTISWFVEELEGAVVAFVTTNAV